MMRRQEREPGSRPGRPSEDVSCRRLAADRARVSTRDPPAAAGGLPLRAELLAIRADGLARPRAHARHVADGPAHRPVSSLSRGGLRSSTAPAAQPQPTREVMEKRAILAAMLMAGLLMLYQTLFMPAETPQPQKTETRKTDYFFSSPLPRARAPRPRARGGRARRFRRHSGAGRAGAHRVRGGPVVSGQGHQSRRGSAGVGAPLSRPEAAGHARSRGTTVSPSSVRGAARARSRLHPLRGLASCPTGKARRGIANAGEDGPGLRISETLRFRADNYTVERLIRVENRNVRRAQTCRSPADARGMAEGQGAVPGPAPDPHRGALAGRWCGARTSPTRATTAGRLERHGSRSRASGSCPRSSPRARASSWSRPR